MKKLFKKAVSVCLTVALTLSMAAVGISSASAYSTTGYYDTCTEIAGIKDRNGCTEMCGIAADPYSSDIYTIKTKSDNSGAVLQKTNKDTGVTTNLEDITRRNFDYLNGAIDMDMRAPEMILVLTGDNRLVEIEVKGPVAMYSGSYKIMLNGAPANVSAVCVRGGAPTELTLYFLSGTQIYSGIKYSDSDTINIEPLFKINTSSVEVNGSYLDLSSYTHQGLCYYAGNIYVPLWGGGAGQENQSVIAGYYDYFGSSAPVEAQSVLSFRFTSGAYTGFKIKGCDISKDGRMYFSADRWNSNDDDHDAILRFNYFVTGRYYPADDIDAPTISNVRVTDVTANGYRVTCDVWDDTSVTSVKFPTWTVSGGQDDLVWHEGTISGNTATFYVKRSEHKGKFGIYNTHIYAYDSYGNYSCNTEASNVIVVDTITSMVFDADFYINKYPDLKKVYGTDYTKLYSHFVKYGIKEGRQAHINFDVKYYLNNNKDLLNTFGAGNYTAAYNHYIKNGYKESRITSATMVFDAAYYSNKYSDLKSAFGTDVFSLYNHFINKGIDEGRQACSSFNVAVYLNSNKDLLNTFGSGNYKAAYKHYLTYGYKENRVKV